MKIEETSYKISFLPKEFLKALGIKATKILSVELGMHYNDEKMTAEEQVWVDVKE